ALPDPVRGEGVAELPARVAARLRAGGRRLPPVAAGPGARVATDARRRGRVRGGRVRQAGRAVPPAAGRVRRPPAAVGARLAGTEGSPLRRVRGPHRAAVA